MQIMIMDCKWSQAGSLQCQVECLASSLTSALSLALSCCMAGHCRLSMAGHCRWLLGVPQTAWARQSGCHSCQWCARAKSVPLHLPVSVAHLLPA